MDVIGYVTLNRVLTFNDRLEALKYIERHSLNPEIYYVEEMR